MKHAAWDMVRKAIDEGMPCYAFDIGPGDYFIIHGYDEIGYYWKAGDETRGPVPWRDLGTTGIVGVILVSSVKPVASADDAKTVKDALRFALGQRLKEKGLEAWIEEQEERRKAGFCYGDIRCFPFEYPKLEEESK